MDLFDRPMFMNLSWIQAASAAMSVGALLSAIPFFWAPAQYGSDRVVADHGAALFLLNPSPAP